MKRLEAEKLLDRMRGNRSRRKGHVDKMAADMREGRWVETHEPIAMSVDGNLIDGQHRLAALVQSGLAGLWFFVAIYETRVTAIGLPIDCGSRRTVADLLGCDRKISEVANSIYRNALTPFNHTPRPDQVQHVIDNSEPHISAVIEHSPGNKRFKGSSVVRAAIVLNILRNKREAGYILAEYARWNAAENLTWPSVMTLNKAVDGTRSIRIESAFWRVVRAFDFNNRDNGSARFGDAAAAAMREQVRQELSFLIKE